MNSFILFILFHLCTIDAFLFLRRLNTFQANNILTKYDSIKQFCTSYEIPTIDDNAKCDGRDMITHTKRLHTSLLNLTGSGLYERMNLTLHNPKDLDIYDSVIKNDRYVVISHGTQDDPIYNFGNL